MMNSSAISSTTPLNEPAGTPLPEVAAFAGTGADASELACLLRLDALLKALGQLLADGKPEGLPELCQQVSRSAEDIALLYARSPQVAALAGEAERRSGLILELRRKLTFCAAMLRRWRRMLALRQQLSYAASEPATYTPQLLSAGAPR